MKHKPQCWPLILILSLTSTALLAQEYDYHPVLSDNFTASLGAMRSSNSFKAGADRLGVPDPFGEDIDFGKSFDVSDSSTFFNGNIRWKFGKKRKWSLAAQYFSNDATGDATLEEDIQWEDIIFREGTYAAAGVKLAVTRLFLGRSFYKNDQNDFGLGVGLHDLELDLFIEGEILIDDKTTEVHRVSESANQPLPNIGGWYNYSPAKNWLIHGRIDWIGADIGDYDGSLWNANLGVAYQAWRHVGFDLTWQYFNLHVDIDKSNWIGGVDLTYSGPVFAVTFGW